jgi:hypothetical protein
MVKAKKSAWSTRSITVRDVYSCVAPTCNFDSSKKLMDKYLGPYQVIEIVNPSAYRLTLPPLVHARPYDTVQVRVIRSIDRLPIPLRIATIIGLGSRHTFSIFLDNTWFISSNLCAGFRTTFMLRYSLIFNNRSLMLLTNNCEKTKSEDRLLLSRQVESKFAHLGCERELRRSSYRNICTNSTKWNTMAEKHSVCTNGKHKSKAY